MTEQEALEFMVDVAYIAFPQARQFVLMNSKNPQETTRAQSKALFDLEVPECLSVIDRWLTGKLPSPFGGEFEQFALHIRATVLQDRSKKARSRPIDEIRRVDRSNHSPILVGPYLDRIWASRDQFKNGEIDRKQFDQVVEDVLRDHDRDYRAAKRGSRAAVESEPAESFSGDWQEG